jgi:Putative porin
MFKRALPMLALAAVLASTDMTAHAQSKGDQALLDALVRKGVLTEKEADQISAETAKEAVTTSASKIQIGDWVQELRIGGDLRIRNQWDQRIPMVLTNPLLGPVDRVIPRDRWRFRLRLTADFKLQGNFFGGVMLATSDNRSSDTKNATYTGAYDLYGIYIARAFMGWAPTPGLTFIAGKQANPFYTTDLIYDPDVDPQGLVERIDFDKFFNMTFGEPVAEGKEGKAPPPPPPAPGNSLELALIAGQFVFNNNNANSGSTQLKWDAYAFQQQLLAKLHLGDKLTITFAPGFLGYNDASSGGSPGPHGSITPPVLVQGQTFDQTGTTTGFGTATAFGDTLANGQAFPVTQRDLNIILAPGDITYKIFGKPLSLYWDFAYNFTGDDRFNRDLGPLFSHYHFVGRSATPTFTGLATPSFSDNSSWLVGLKFGENKKAGDFSISADYRQWGISSIDPNINNSNFALSNLNTQGWEFNGAYNLTDFLTAVVTLYYSHALHPNLYGGYATGNVINPATGAQFPGSQQFPIARDRQDIVLQCNLIMKF